MTDLPKPPLPPRWQARAEAGAAVTLQARTGTPIYFGDPEFEGFESVLDLAPAGKAA